MAKYTPMIEQYLQIKKEHQDCILFFRLGDFYEMFFEDARTASRELEIVLTGRDGGQEEKIPMCGIPYHSANTYIARLISRGYRIAICEQVEDPKTAKGIVKREVIKIITPGTVIDESMLEDNRNNYLAALVEEDEKAGFAYIDISTADFYVTEIAGDNCQLRLESELLRIAPTELLVSSGGALHEEWQLPPGLVDEKIVTELPEEALYYDRAEEMLLRHFKVESLESFGLRDNILGIKAAAGILAYLRETQKTGLEQVQSIRVYNTEDYLDMDYHTRRNLELTSTMREGKREGSLLELLDLCATAMGKRLLRKWIEQPLKDIKAIIRRQDALAEIKDVLLFGSDLKSILGRVYDLERLAGKLGSGSANPRDLLALKNSINALSEIKEILITCNSGLLQEISKIDSMTDLCELIDCSIDTEAPLTIKEGGIIKAGYSPEIDELKGLSEQGSTWLMDFEVKEKERTGIKYLKVGFNRVFGYYIEVSKSNLNLVPADYTRRQTLANTERYICEELKNYEDKILGARERLYNLEYEEFIKIRELAAKHIKRIQETAAKVATLDVMYSLAEVAYKNDYIRPVIDDSGIIEIKSGRHPVVEQNLYNTRFVPNDVKLDNSRQNFAIITGPNMGGKSTYMRQIALIVLMAQMGSFIPAEQGRIGIVDKIFTRVGASDDLAAGQSTFMVEMVEVANILYNATSNSLIILDEIGRGTSTYDGLSIARAVSEYILENIKARTLFATHYHEITDLSERYEQLINLSVSVHETGESVVFLKKVLPGKADKSYGIQVARLAGLPAEVIKRATEVLDELEKTPVCISEQDMYTQPSLFTPENPIVQEMEQIDVNDISPREALDLLYRWKMLI